MLCVQEFLHFDKQPQQQTTNNQPAKQRQTTCEASQLFGVEARTDSDGTRRQGLVFVGADGGGAGGAVRGGWLWVGLPDDFFARPDIALLKEPDMMVNFEKHKDF